MFYVLYSQDLSTRDKDDGINYVYVTYSKPLMDIRTIFT